LARTGDSSCNLQERFQRSGDTISKAIHEVLNMLVAKPFYVKYVKLPTTPNESAMPSEITDNSKLYPFFKDVFGAIDSSHIDMFVPDEALPCYRNWK
ncbi:hypothetical protein NEOLEDRAFT_1026187, partial [Neolentinus lepideus HHB14362 ss-1]